MRAGEEEAMKPSRWLDYGLRKSLLRTCADTYSERYYRRLVAYYVGEARRWHRNAMYCKATMERLAKR
jgi:hypothetical protein